MNEKRWAFVFWAIVYPLLILLAAIPSFGFTLVFLIPWWIGGPYYFNRKGDRAPYWQPIEPQKLWWRNIR